MQSEERFRYKLTKRFTKQMARIKKLKKDAKGKGAEVAEVSGRWEEEKGQSLEPCAAILDDETDRTTTVKRVQFVKMSKLGNRLADIVEDRTVEQVDEIEETTC